MLVGGLAALMQQRGGLAFISQKIEAIIKRFSQNKSKRVAEFGIASLASLTNASVANNTVSIIVTGNIAKELAQKEDVSAKRSASLLDIFSCVVQGVLPYSAQALLAASIFSISPLAAVANAWYCFVLAFVSIIIISIRK